MNARGSLILNQHDFKHVNFKYNLAIYIFKIQANITLEWKPEDLVIIYSKSTLFQVLALYC